MPAPRLHGRTGLSYSRWRTMGICVGCRIERAGKKDGHDMALGVKCHEKQTQRNRRKALDKLYTRWCPEI